MRQVHLFAPVYNNQSSILIMGSFPSVRSREEGFYYGHPANRFWKVLAGVLGSELPVTIKDKKDILLFHKIALWDVIQSCEIDGSNDSSIRNVIVNDVNLIIENSNINRIYANGGTAFRLYKKYVKPKTGLDIFYLPSTSPANAGYSLEKLIQAWSKIKLN